MNRVGSHIAFKTAICNFWLLGLEFATGFMLGRLLGPILPWLWFEVGLREWVLR